MKIKVVNKSKHQLPQYAGGASAGIDLRANPDNDVLFKQMGISLVPTGIFLDIPIGYEAQIRARSSVAIKNGITILNSPGTINGDYRSEVCNIMVNLSSENFVIRDGERIRQMIIAKHEKAEWIKVEDLIDTERGIVGFGHTGKR